MSDSFQQQSCILPLFPSVLIFKFTTQLNVSDHEMSVKDWTDLRTSSHLFANMHAAGSELEIISIFVNPNGNRNKLTCTNWWEMCTHKQVFKETEKKRENTIVQRSLLATRFMLELQKLLIKYSNKGVRLLLGSFPFFITCSSLHGNYGWRLGTSSIRDTSSNRHITVHCNFLNCIHRDKYEAYYFFIKKGLELSV